MSKCDCAGGDYSGHQLGCALLAPASLAIKLAVDRGNTFADELLRVNTEVERLRTMGEKINAIRNSIVGTQRVNWSAHVYPLVAALDEAGFEAQSYGVARAEAATLIEQCNAAEAERDEAIRARDAVLALDPGDVAQAFRDGYLAGAVGDKFEAGTPFVEQHRARTERLRAAYDALRASRARVSVDPGDAFELEAAVAAFLVT